MQLSFDRHVPFPSLLTFVSWGSLFCSHLAAVCPAAMAAAIRVVIEAYLTAIQIDPAAPTDRPSSTSLCLEQSTAAYLLELFGVSEPDPPPPPPPRDFLSCSQQQTW